MWLSLTYHLIIPYSKLSTLSLTAPLSPIAYHLPSESSHSVIVESLVGCLRCVFFFVKQSLEPANLSLHVLVDLQIASHDHLHFVHIVVNVTVFRVLALDVLDELALLCDHMSHFLKVLKMI